MRNKRAARSANPDRSGEQRRGRAMAARVEGAERSLDKAMARERKSLAEITGHRNR